MPSGISTILRRIREPLKLHYNEAMEIQREISRVYRKVNLYEQTTDFAYWQSKLPVERLAALESIRYEYHGWTYETQPRLQRVYTIVKR